MDNIDPSKIRRTMTTDRSTLQYVIDRLPEDHGLSNMLRELLTKMNRILDIGTEEEKKETTEVIARVVKWMEDPEYNAYVTELWSGPEGMELFWGMYYRDVNQIIIDGHFDAAMKSGNHPSRDVDWDEIDRNIQKYEEQYHDDRFDL